MAVSYNKLFKLLIDKKMKKKELCAQAGVSLSTMSKMGRGETVSMDVIGKICRTLDCSVDEILDFLPEEGETEAQV